MGTTWEQFEEMLSNQDWLYVYAEGDAYERGRKSLDKLSCTYINLSLEDKARVLKLWNSYAPKGYKMKANDI